jgi:hypothetical protein
MRAQASPVSDLGSASQEVRMRAAEMIRDQHLYKATPRAPWDEMTSSFTTGVSAQTIITRLHERGAAPRASADDFKAGMLTVRLDDWWTLTCVMKDSQLIEYRIVEKPNEIAVEPPAGYSGFWRTYRINGKLAGLYDYQNGRNLGNTLHMQ